MKKNRFFILPILLGILLLGCPTAAPEAKKKGGGDDGDGGDGDKGYVCPALSKLPADTPEPSVGDTTGRVALQALVDAAITVGNPSPDLNHIDTSKITSMEAIFRSKHTFNGNVSCWDTSNVTSMVNTFSGVASFSGDISDWDTKKVTSMNSMFSGASSFNGDISDWDIGEVTNTAIMFNNTPVFNGDISGWNTKEVTVMSGMFLKAISFNRNLSGWNVGLVTAHGGFSTNSKLTDAFHPKWCDNATGNRNKNCASFP